MAELPIAPRFDLDESPTTAGPSPRAQPVAPPSFDVAELTEALAPPRPPPVAATAAGVTRAVESVEEVLHQTSEQTVRLVHLEDRVKDLGRGFDDLREELLAGFTEMRGIVEQDRQAMFRVESTQAEASSAMQQRITGRLEAVEEQTGKTHKRQSLLLGLVVGQGLLLLAVLWMVMGLRDGLAEQPRELSKSAEASPRVAESGVAHAAGEPAAEVAPASAQAAAENDAAEAQRRKAKARKRTR